MEQDVRFGKRMEGLWRWKVHGEGEDILGSLMGKKQAIVTGGKMQVKEDGDLQWRYEFSEFMSEYLDNRE